MRAGAPLAGLALSLAACAPLEVRLAREPLADGATPSCAPVASHCDAIPALPVPPVLDGALEPCGLALERIPDAQWMDGDAPPAELSTELAIAWRPDGLYFYVHVTDSTRAPSTLADQAWCGDAVHLFADADGAYASAGAYDEPGTIQLIARAPDTDAPRSEGDRYDPARRRGAWDASRFVAVPTADGWAVEAFVTAAELELASLVLARGGRVGIDVSVSVSGTSIIGTDAPECAADRLGDYSYRDASDASGRVSAHRSTLAFCNPVLR